MCCVPAHTNPNGPTHGAKRFMRQREQNDPINGRVKISVYASTWFRDDLNALAAENSVTVSKLLFDLARDYIEREAPLLAQRNKVFEDLGW
jgi:hypothetical protein